MDNSNSFIPEILKNDNMISVERAINIYHLLCRAIYLNVKGEVVELGCNAGLTSILIQKTLNQHKCKKRLYVYDSFEGLPEKHQKDGKTVFKKGKCKTSRNKFVENFKKFDLKLPKIHEGWFRDTLSRKLPNKICFAHLDGDFYSSIKESLENIYNRLERGAIVVIDDYCDPEINCKMNKNFKNYNFSFLKHSERIKKLPIVNNPNILPGVKKACDEFFKDKNEKVEVIFGGFYPHGYFCKK